MKKNGHIQFYMIISFLFFGFFNNAFGQSDTESDMWEKVKSSRDYELCVKFCDEFPKSIHRNEAWDLKTQLGKEMIKERFGGIFDFFNEVKPYDSYFSKHCLLNGEEMKFPITKEFKTTGYLRFLTEHIKDLGTILTAYLKDLDYDAEFRYSMNMNRLSLEFHFWPGGYGYYYTITFEYEKDSSNNEILSVSEILISPPESYD